MRRASGESSRPEPSQRAITDTAGSLWKFPRKSWSASCKLFPARIFQPQSCFLVRFRRGQEALDLLQENAARKRLFARQSFWEGLLELARNGLRYSAYSHADKADVFVLLLDSEGNQMLRAILPLLKPRSAADRLNRFRPERIEWLSRR